MKYESGDKGEKIEIKIYSVVSVYSGSSSRSFIYILIYCKQHVPKAWSASVNRNQAAIEIYIYISQKPEEEEEIKKTNIQPIF